MSSALSALGVEVSRIETNLVDLANRIKPMMANSVGAKSAGDPVREAHGSSELVQTIDGLSARLLAAANHAQELYNSVEV